MRRDDYGPASWCKQPVELFHCADDVRHVLDDMNGPHLAEGAITKWERILVQICNHVRTRVRIAVEANCAGILVDAAADIEDREFGRRLAHQTSFLKTEEAGRGAPAQLRELPHQICSGFTQTGRDYERAPKHCSSVSIAKFA